MRSPTADEAAQMLRREVVLSELEREVAMVEQAQLHELSTILPTSMKRLLSIVAAYGDNTILHQGGLMSRLHFSTETLHQLDALRNFTGAVSTWQLCENNDEHRVFKTGERSKFYRTLCTVETALLIVRNADKQQLLETGNFVVTPSIIEQVQNGMWQLQCACPQRTKNQDWPKVQEHGELRFE